MKLTSLGLVADRQIEVMGSSERNHEEADPGGYLVPAGTTWSQILDYVSGSGDYWPLELYSVGFPMSRGTAIRYAVVHRCVSLIAGIISGLITAGSGSLYVLDRDGKRVKTRRTNNITDVLTYEPSDDGTSPFSFWEDLVADYCLDGNGILHPGYGLGSGLQKLRRMVAHTAHTRISDGGNIVYRLTPATGQINRDHMEMIAKRDLIHTRWPLLVSTATDKSGFAIPTVIALRSSLDIGIWSDKYIKDWFKRGVHPGIHIDYEEKPHVTPPNKEQKLQIRQAIENQIKAQGPLVTFGGKSTTLEDTPQSAETLKLREYQLREVLGFFGIMIPFHSGDITSWGKGIEQLSKLNYRFGINQHLGRLLSPCTHNLLNRGETLRVDPTEFLRGDNENIAKLINALQGDAQKPPLASQTELRKIGGLPRDVDGEIDDRLVKATIEGSKKGTPAPARKGEDNDE